MPKTMPSQFQPHGSYTARIEGRILVAHTTGSWNKEMFQESVRIAGPLILELNQSGPWAYVAVVEETMVYHQEVLAKASVWVQGAYASELKAAAWVLRPDLEGYRLLKPAYAKAYGGYLPNEVFGTLEEASAWLRPFTEAR